MQYSTEIIHLTIIAAGIEYYGSPDDSAPLDWLQSHLFVSMWCHTVGPDPSEDFNKNLDKFIRAAFHQDGHIRVHSGNQLYFFSRTPLIR